MIKFIKRHLKRYHLPDSAKPKAFIGYLHEAEQVTVKRIGFICRRRYFRTGEKIEIKQELEAISIWLKPYLFLIDFKGR